MNRLDKFVLTVKPECYSNYIKLDHPATLPVNNEQVIRTGAYNIFQFLVKCRNSLFFWKSREVSMVGDGNGSSCSEFSGEKSVSGKSLFQKFKDAVSSTLTYPDEANYWILSAVLAGRRILTKEKIDVIFATGKPWSALIVAFFLKKQGVKLIVDFRDPWVNNPFELGFSEVRKRVDAFFEQKVVKKADTVFLNTADLQKEFRKRYPEEPARKFVTVTNGFDAADFSIKTQGTIDSKTSDFPDDLVITHAGVLYGLRDPIAIFKAIDRFYRHYPDEEHATLLFRQVGKITLDYDPGDYIDAESNKDFFDNVGQVSYDTCLQYLALSDILLIIQPDTKTQIPSKLFEYVFLEKPILTIAPLDGALAAMILKYGFGSIFDPEDIEGILRYFIDASAQKKGKGALHCTYENKDQFDVKNIATEFERLLLEG